ncbi:MAG: L-2-hydroxyglutarate oxidase [Actinomycetota bacterium]
MTYDAVVIGGGLVGLATAHRLLEGDGDLSVAVVEREPAVAVHQSGRNSGVLHSGIYYRPGSFRAALCTRGKRELEAYADDRGIPIRRLGKLVVAVEDAERPRLHDLFDRGRANGIEGLELLGADALRELEPNVTGVEALRVPGTAVVDFRAVAERLADDVRARGGSVLLGRTVQAVHGDRSGQTVSTDRGELSARFVVGCAGLQADRLATVFGHRISERVVPFRGTFHGLIRGGEDLVRGLVYPVPDPTLPFLGVHFTPQTDGSVRIGPNAVLALAREGRWRWSVSPRDVTSWLRYPGFWRLARRHARSGVDEVRRELSRRAFLRAYRRYVPALEAVHLGPAFFGTRAQLLGRSGEMLDDFVLHEAPGRLLVLNAPSPAATACLAIGEVVAERVRAGLSGRGR